MKTLTEKDLGFIQMLVNQHEMICHNANKHTDRHQDYNEHSGERYLKDLFIKLENLKELLFNENNSLS